MLTDFTDSKLPEALAARCDELLACPHCGRAAHLRQQLNHTDYLRQQLDHADCYFYAECELCWARTGYHTQPEIAVARWNSRHANV